MKNIVLIYVSDYLFDEEKELKKLGLRTFRIENINKVSMPNEMKNAKAIIRSKRIDSRQYSKLYKALNLSNLNLVNSPSLYNLHRDNESNYRMISKFSPKSFFFDENSDLDEIKAKLNKEDFSLPLFIRTDIESVFKYVGLEGCLIKTNFKTELKKCLSHIEKYIKSYSKLIIKEIKNIKKNDSNINYEYRAVVVDDIVISYDYNKKLPTPHEINIAKKIERIIKEISNNGFKGSYFMDFALTDSGEIIIIESKDLINGTIHNVNEFGKKLIEIFDS